MKTRIPSNLLDRTGMTASIACAIHCAALPIIASLLPLYGMEFLSNPLFELAMLSLSVLIGISALFTSYKIHRQKLPFMILMLGFIFIACGHLLAGLEAFLIPVGGVLIAASHLLNIKLNHKCRKDHHN
ncbi:MerC domain-containing protein [Pedobacter lithocola]|uniref:MerC domain-containing protein n=1 Tax=Pedobacter lithocola TaxID=1908239 RepID=A0ABV8PDK3_9SPHI